MRRVFIVFALIVMLPLHGAWSESPSQLDSDEFARIITAQIEAFRADDGPQAYSFAAPVIQQIFPSPESFMAMVKQGYMPVYRPQSFRFGPSGSDSAGRPTQLVSIVGPDGQTYDALYTFERQADGSWRIAGCRLLQKPGLNT